MFLYFTEKQGRTTIFQILTFVKTQPGFEKTLIEPQVAQARNISIGEHRRASALLRNQNQCQIWIYLKTTFCVQLNIVL